VRTHATSCEFIWDGVVGVNPMGVGVGWNTF